MLVAFWLEVDLLLRAAQPAEILVCVAHVGIRRQQETHHERRVDDLSEAKLLRNVELRTENVDRGDFSSKQQPRAIVWRADESQIDLIAREKRFEALNCRVVAT